MIKSFYSSRNMGFITENSGIATGLADGSLIYHGLAGTPTSYTLEVRNSNYYVNVQAAYVTQDTI